MSVKSAIMILCFFPLVCWGLIYFCIHFAMLNEKAVVENKAAQAKSFEAQSPKYCPDSKIVGTGSAKHLSNYKFVFCEDGSVKWK